MACLLVSKASRLASRTCGSGSGRWQAGTACLLVSKASRLTSRTVAAAATGAKPGRLAYWYVRRASRLTFPGFKPWAEFSHLFASETNKLSQRFLNLAPLGTVISLEFRSAIGLIQKLDFRALSTEN